MPYEGISNDTQVGVATLQVFFRELLKRDVQALGKLWRDIEEADLEAGISIQGLLRKVGNVDPSNCSKLLQDSTHIAHIINNTRTIRRISHLVQNLYTAVTCSARAGCWLRMPR